MKIEIDTNRDSKEEIRNAIKILQNSMGMIGEGIVTNVPDAVNEDDEEKPDFVNIFNDYAKGSDDSKEDSAEDSDNSGYVNMFAPNEPEEKSEVKNESNNGAQVMSNDAGQANPLANFFSNNDAPPKNDENDKSTTENMTESSSRSVDEEDSDKNDDYLKINDFLSKHNDEEEDNEEDKEEDKEEDGKDKPKIKFY